MSNWKIDAENLSLVHEPSDYDCDLERCRSSAEILDWICQLAGKRYIKDSELGEVVRMLNGILMPQSWACSGACAFRTEDRPFSGTAEEFRERIMTGIRAYLGGL